MKFIYIIFLFSFSTFGNEIVIDIEVEQKNTKGVVERAVKQLSYELINDILDPSRVEEKKKKINRIINQKSNRYILYTKKGTVHQKKDSSNFIIPVTLGFSEENLRHILLEEEIFYSDSFHTRILPLIVLEDRVERKSYGWWFNQTEELVWQKSMSNLYNQLQSELMAYGFYLVNPEFAGFQGFIPKKLQARLPKKRLIFDLAKYFNTHLVLTGSVRIKEMDDESIFNVKADFIVYHTKSGRVLAEIERVETVNLSENHSEYKNNKSSQVFSTFLKRQKGFSKGLGMQLGALYRTGQISSNLLKITIHGKLAYRHFENFKKQLIAKVAPIKDLKENIIRSNGITYLANTNDNTVKIIPLILKAKFSGFNVKVKTHNRREIKLNVSLK